MVTKSRISAGGGISWIKFLREFPQPHHVRSGIVLKETTAASSKYISIHGLFSSYNSTSENMCKRVVN
jgi:hypothetical protein